MTGKIIKKNKFLGLTSFIKKIIPPMMNIAKLNHSFFNPEK